MSASLRKRIAALTEEHGGDYAVQHANRLIRLVEAVAEGVAYDREAIWLAAHMHDWGTFPRWSKEEVPHSRRSADLASAELKKLKCPPDVAKRALEAIEYHHGGAEGRSVEALLLCDADALDGLGAMGVLREFAAIPTEAKGCYSAPRGWGMRGAYERAKMRMENNPRMLRLPKSRQLAQEKMKEMTAIFSALEKESFGHL